MRKRSNSTGGINKKKSGNTATLTRNPSAPNLLKRRKPLVKISRGMLKNLLPKNLSDSIKGNVSKNILTLESPDKSYNSISWKDNDGPKMFITLDSNFGQDASDNILSDLEQISKSKDQDILPTDNSLPPTIIIDTERNNEQNAEQLVRQVVNDFNRQNEQGKQFQVSKVERKNLQNDTVGLTFSITEQADLPQQKQRDDEDDLPDEIIIQPKGFIENDDTDEQDQLLELNTLNRLSIVNDENKPAKKIEPVISVEAFKQKTPGGLIRSKEYKAMVKSLENYHKTKNEYAKRLKKEGDSDALFREYHKKLLETGHQLGTANSKYLENRSQDPNKRKAVKDLTDQILTLNDGNISKELENIRGIIPESNKLARSLEKFNTDTASEVFIATTKGTIEDSNTNKGYAKKAVTPGDLGNDATANIGFASKGDKIKEKEDPNLIARQVASYRVAKAFGSNLIAPEVFSTDSDGTTIGITAEVANATQAMKNGVDEQGKKIQEHTIFSFSKAKTQKDLADLQIMDAINGQLDRHLGNIFINKETGEVITIDQDQSHPLPRSTNFSPVAETNNTLVEQFERGEDGRLVYKQQQVDAETAEKIIAMEPDTLRGILEEIPMIPNIWMT